MVTKHAVAIDGLDSRLTAALCLDEDYWKVGDRGVVVWTESGSKYTLLPDGTVDQVSSSSGHRLVSGHLVGSVYRPGGPIRMGVAVHGLRMEIARGKARVTVTTPIMAIEDHQ